MPSPPATHGQPPAPGTKEFSLYAQRAFAGRFSDTPAVRDLWEEARRFGGNDPPPSRDGFNRVRDRFWRLMRDDTSKNGQIVRAILKEAGFDVGGEGAPRLNLERKPSASVTRTGLTAADIGARMLKETAIDRDGRQLTPEQRAVRDDAERSLDIDHAYPAARAVKDLGNPEMWLDAANLQFMGGDDNRWHKGDRYLK
jgi:hypothetical protein